MFEKSLVLGLILDRVQKTILQFFYYFATLNGCKYSQC